MKLEDWETASSSGLLRFLSILAFHALSKVVLVPEIVILKYCDDDWNLIVE